MTAYKIVWTKPLFLYFSSANLTMDYKNWNLTKPLSGTILLVLQSAPDIELVVINVKSAILRGSYLLMILA